MRRTERELETRLNVFYGLTRLGPGQGQKYCTPTLGHGPRLVGRFMWTLTALFIKLDIEVTKLLLLYVIETTIAQK